MGEVLSREELVRRVARDRTAGKSVALANGCFDILHVGHIRYLQAAAAEADRLIVAVNDDQSVRDLKGEGRPVLAAADRAELVAALRGVHYVIVFPEPTVGPLLEALKPDVHCKGTDYTLDSVPERDIVKGYGGRIAIVGDPKDHSTCELLARIGAGGSAHTDGGEPARTGGGGTARAGDGGTARADDGGTARADNGGTVRTDSGGTARTGSGETPRTGGRETTRTDGGETPRTRGGGTRRTDGGGT